MALIKYRIVYSKQANTFKIQYRDFFFFWSDLEYKLNSGDAQGWAHEFDTKEEALDKLKDLKAYDWVEVK